MKVCIVTNRLAPDEGQGRVNFEIARLAAEAGHQITCLAHEVSPALHVRPNISWGFMPDANYPAALLGNLHFARRSNQWLTRHASEFDIIIGNGCNTYFPVTLNVIHFVHCAWRHSPVHDARIHKGPRGWYQWLYSWLNAALERRILPRAKVLIAVSDKVKRELAHIGLPADTIQVIHNGVNTEEFKPGSADRTHWGLPSGVPLAFFAGDISTPRKNLDSVLRALARVPRLHLAVAGSTTGSPFPALSKQLGVADRTHFLGFRRDIPDLMRAMDFFAFPSRYEACSLVLLEAMASGLPIVTARTAGGAELVDGCGIVLDDPDDLDGLTEAFTLLVNDKEHRAALSQKARSQALLHTWTHMAKEYLTLMEEIPVRQTPVAVE